MEWKELTVDNMPISLDEYHIQYLSNEGWKNSRISKSRPKLIRALIESPYQYRYKIKELI